MRLQLVVALLSASLIAAVAWAVARAAPLSAQDAAPCNVEQIAASVFWQGATGALGGGIVVQNIGAQPCAVQGVPDIGLADGQEVPLPVAQSRATVPPVSRAAVVLQPGDEASAFLVWYNWCNAPPVDGVYVLLTLQNQTVAVGGWDGKPLVGRARCDNPSVPGDPTSGRSFVNVDAFQSYPPGGS